MSAVADPGAPELPPGWERLERAVQEAARSVADWRARALRAEAEVVRLREALEEIARGTTGSGDTQQLRAENVALRGRMSQAYGRVEALLARIVELEERE